MAEGDGARWPAAALARAGALARELTFPRVCYYLAAAALVSAAVGVATGAAVVMPALDVLAVAPALAWVRRGRRLSAAVFVLLFWAFAKAAALAALTAAFPARAAAAVPFGPSYAEGMVLWLRSGADVAGVGALGATRWLATLAVAALSAATAGIGGLAAASVLLNCQAYYLGILFTRSSDPLRVLLFGWPIWELFRALGLANVMVAAAEPLLCRVLRVPPLAREARDILLVGLVLLVAAYVAQLELAPYWRLALAPTMDFSTGTALWP